jgi:hypothetical protein
LGSLNRLKENDEITNIGFFEKFPTKYEEWFKINLYIYQSELHAVKDLLREGSVGIEVGIGSGRFAQLLGITSFQ